MCKMYVKSVKWWKNHTGQPKLSNTLRLILRKNIILLHVRRSDTTFYIYFKNIFLWEQFSVHIALVVQLVRCYDIVKVGYDVLLHILDE